MAETEYERGKRDAESVADRDLSLQAHLRLDKMEPRVTALERFMWSGMTIVVGLNVIPVLQPWLSE